MINIFSGSYIEVMNIKNLLESINIEVFTQNENMANIEPWAVSSGGFNPVILKVNDEDFDKAKKIIEDYENGNLNIEVEETEKE
ncbi:putative signal transducing protein [Flavobacterium aquicola]|uniref:Putative signal transducing protein n=1 Tax=Flavobacterium aquicola TaxID=1682742 RepID=A0A3E0E0H1_9FLAO|nr:DUF2007 domain-containing protein [Flavobacterium aquicola]REG91130.1 putative signal transducing protein [Flavobacterium aquicola]